MERLTLQNLVADLLLELERELRQQALWANELPDPMNLLSPEPFACDVMDLHHWLQWIFIPRIKTMLEQDANLPTNCSIAPYAEQVFPAMPENTALLLDILKRIDQALS